METKTIQLTKGYTTIVDSADYEWLSSFNWCSDVRDDGRKVYAVRGIRKDGKKSIVRMHRFITGVTDTKIQVDHKDSDGLNNSRENLRVCNHLQNCFNSKRGVSNTSGFKGVTLHKPTGLWRATIAVEGKQVSLGYFKTKEPAALAYDHACVKYFGEFARPNEKQLDSSLVLV